MVLHFIVTRPSWMLFSIIALMTIRDRYYAPPVSADTQAMVNCFASLKIFKNYLIN